MIIIAEKINASRKSIGIAIKNKDDNAIREQIVEQDKAGAHYIDLNAGTDAGTEEQEIQDICWLIDIALDCTEKKLCIDSDNPVIIQKAAEYINKRRPIMLNSVKYDVNLLAKILPVAANFDAPVVALAMGNEGIPNTVEERLKVTTLIVEEAQKYNVPPEKLLIDPLVLPISADYTNGMTTLETLRAIKKTYPNIKTTMGVSNIGFGLKKRVFINEAFIIGAIIQGLDTAIVDPTKASIQRALTLGELIGGKDKYCRKFTRSVRTGLFDDNK